MNIAIPACRFLKSMALIKSSLGFSWESTIRESTFIFGDDAWPCSISPIFELLQQSLPELVSIETQKALSQF